MILFLKRECAVTTPSARARDAELAQKLWDESCRMVGLEPKENLAEMMAMLARDVSAK